MQKPLESLLFIVAIAGCGGPSESPNELIGRRANQPGPPSDIAATEPTDGAEPAAATEDTTEDTTDGTTGDTAPAVAGTPPTDGGTADAGATDSGTTAPTNDGFTGAPAYVAQSGPSTIRGDHPFAGGNPTKQNCLQSQCHGPGGQAPTFIAGGSVFLDVAGTMPAAQIEVRIRDADGDARIARTDANGNFFFRAGNNTVGFPARVGARNASVTRLMGGTIANGACNSTQCHGGPQGVIHVP